MDRAKAIMLANNLSEELPREFREIIRLAWEILLKKLYNNGYEVKSVYVGEDRAEQEKLEK